MFKMKSEVSLDNVGMVLKVLKLVLPDRYWCRLFINIYINNIFIYIRTLTLTIYRDICMSI